MDAGKNEVDSVTDWIQRMAVEETVRGELGKDEVKCKQFL